MHLSMAFRAHGVLPSNRVIISTDVRLSIRLYEYVLELFLRLDGLSNHGRSTGQLTNSGSINPSLNRRSRTFLCGCRFCRIGYQDDATLYSESA